MVKIKNVDCPGVSHPHDLTISQLIEMGEVTKMGIENMSLGVVVEIAENVWSGE